MVFTVIFQTGGFLEMSIDVIAQFPCLRIHRVAFQYFCEGCAAVISLRSGLCDLLGFTETKLIVINTSEELFREWNLRNVFERKGIYNVNSYSTDCPLFPAAYVCIYRISSLFQTESQGLPKRVGQ